MALLFCRTRHRSVANPSIIRLLSTSSSPPEDPTSGDGNRNTESNNSSPRTSYFSDIRASLKKQHPQRTAATNFDEVRKNLSEFRRSSTADSQPQRQILLQELFNKEGLRRPHDQNTTAPGTAGARDSFDAIKESLKQLSSIKDRLKMRPEQSNAGPRVIGGTQEWLPMVSLNDKVKESGEESDSKGKFLKIYSVTELGEKLRKLRPEGLGKEGGFSFTELNERLIKLREMEEKLAKEAESNSSLLTFSELRKSLNALQTSDEDKKKAANRHRYPFLSPLDKTADFINHPPKEHLVEKYFHPDNMSSAEKMKVELANVREEFKMSESDCGSARVQVAQLTTKIKHLSDVLHKKDKHSKKGLQAMVERRKKLLKYLRRTDWDSYCIVLSKLGLRDNPDYKQSNAINKKKLLSR